MTIKLPPHIEQAIIAKAQEQGLSVNELIAKWAMQENKPNPMIVRAMANLAPSILGDGVAIKRELRNQWA